MPITVESVILNSFGSWLLRFSLKSFK
jgi:hypothetical protein